MSLAQLKETPDNLFVIERTYDVPRQLMFDVWTKKEMMGWWGPKGVTVEIDKLDLRAGGMNLYCMHSEHGFPDMWGRFVYKEVMPPSRLVWLNAFSDPTGGLTRHPMMPTWPAEMLTTVTFDEIAPNKTRVTIEWTPYNATAEEEKVFSENKPSMQQGWTGTLDKLAEFLTDKA